MIEENLIQSDAYFPMVDDDELGLGLYAPQAGARGSPRRLGQTSDRQTPPAVNPGQTAKKRPTGAGSIPAASTTLSPVLAYYENTGSATSPAFLELTGAGNPLDGVDVGGRSMPALGDVDRDGDLDLVAGEYGGTLFYFENTGDANPLNGIGVGATSAPAVGDLDRDGDLDVVVSATDGTFPTFYLPEPSAWLGLGAGGALLGWLARWRRRRA